MDKQKQIEEMAKYLLDDEFDFMLTKTDAFVISRYILKKYQPKIPEGAVLLTDKELYEELNSCKVAMIVYDDDGEKYVSLDDYNEYTERLGKIASQRKARIEELEKLLDDRCDHCIERERKETAEKFAERLKGMAYQSADWSHGEHPMVVEVDYIDEIAKEFTEE